MSIAPLELAYISEFTRAVASTPPLVRRCCMTHTRTTRFTRGRGGLEVDRVLLDIQQSAEVLLHRLVRLDRQHRKDVLGAPFHDDKSRRHALAYLLP